METKMIYCQNATYKATILSKEIKKRLTLGNSIYRAWKYTYIGWKLNVVNSKKSKEKDRLIEQNRRKKRKTKNTYICMHLDILNNMQKTEKKT